MATVLVLDMNSLCEYLHDIFAASKDLIVVQARSEVRLLEEAQRLRPGLVILNLTAVGRLHQLLRQLLEIIPGLPIFVFTDQYGFDLETEALLSGATGVFSTVDEPSSILANVQAVVC